MNDLIDMEELQQRIAETIAWCRMRVKMSDLAGSLRTPALRPHNLLPGKDDWNHYDSEIVKIGAVTDLANRRRDLLKAENIAIDTTHPNLYGGRVLVMIPEFTDSSGMSEPETEGFIDVEDKPAWDTWICYVRDDRHHSKREIEWYQERYGSYPPPAKLNYLLAWVPPELFEMMEVAYDVNPMKCFFWAADYREHDSGTLLLKLEEAGWLT